MDYYYLVKYIDNKGKRKLFYAKNYKGILHLCYIHKKLEDINLIIPPLIHCRDNNGTITQLHGIVRYYKDIDKFIIIRKEDK